MAVRTGAARPDIGTTEAFIETMLNAESIGYSASASGTYLSNELFPRLGIWQHIEGKSLRVVSERVAVVVARGDVQIGFQQISEILPIDGIDYVGPIPDELQEITVFSAGIATAAQYPEGAGELLRFLSSKQAAPIIAGVGLEPMAMDEEKWAIER